ncbi:hypothetical protein UY416_25780, partial [Paenibacillus polymyxa]|uniref:hypothetical protein n=1 Tax=Paenibacillus polymyxa TaxID=1406 RepID=UPI002AB421C8
MSDAGLRVIKPYRKLILSGNVCEVYEMDSKPYNLRVENRESGVEWIRDMEEEAERIEAEQIAKAWENFSKLDPNIQKWLKALNRNGTSYKLQRNIMRTRNMVRRLILSNFDTKSKFWT